MNSKQIKSRTKSKQIVFNATPQTSDWLLQGLCRFKGAVREPNLQGCLLSISKRTQGEMAQCLSRQRHPDGNFQLMGPKKKHANHGARGVCKTLLAVKTGLATHALLDLVTQGVAKAWPMVQGIVESTCWWTSPKDHPLKSMFIGRFP